MKRKGFTLIEIMIVIAIIVILVMIAIAAGDSAKKVARDNQRKTDVALLQLKLEIYRDKYGVYPQTLNGSSNSLTTPGTGGADDLPIIISSVLPHDPSLPSSDPNYHYQYIALKFNSSSVCGSSYYLAAQLEGSTASQASIDRTDLKGCDGSEVPAPPTKALVVTSPSAFSNPN